MLIATPEAGRFRVVDAFAKSVRLGSGLERTGHLSRGAVGRTLAALEICADKLERHRVANVRLVATEACRRARNGNHFLAMAARQTGLRLEVIRPEEEARLAVISCAPLVSPQASQLLVFDIGGGSTELIWLDLSGIEPERRAQAIVDLEMGGVRRPGGGAHRRLHLGAARGGDAARALRRRRRRRGPLRADGLVLRGADRRLSSLHRVDDRRRRRLPDDRHLGDGDDRRGGAPRASALRPAQGRRDDALGAGDRRGDQPLPAARAGGAAGRHRPRARPLGADHVGGGDPADAARGSGRPTRCASPTAGCARGCCSR